VPRTLHSFLLRAAAAALLAAAAAARPLDAQIFKVPRRVAEPAVWVGVSVGYFQLQDVADSESNSIWAFSGTAQYRASLEYSLGRGSSVGVTGAYARIPLVYESLDGSPICPAATCGLLAPRVDAHADVTSFMATFHAGGGEGFHYVVDAGLGATRFSGFRADRGSLTLRPESDLDPAFTIATGFGYSTSARTEFTLVQEYGNVFHQRGSLPNDVRTNAQQLTTRLGVRFGAGSRRAR
jgi:hypothetical protein